MLLIYWLPDKPIKSVYDFILYGNQPVPFLSLFLFSIPFEQIDLMPRDKGDFDLHCTWNTETSPSLFSRKPNKRGVHSMTLQHPALNLFIASINRSVKAI